MQGTTSEILFEKFEIIEVLKKDEHAAVFLANHIYLSKKIILKVLDTQKLPDHSIVERFKREAKILARLDHPNIIKVLDFGTSKDFFYISFEYIEGESMRQMLKTKSLSFEQKEHLMIQLLKGLDYAHKNQIIHRDIKPENIFVDKSLALKVGDFGLALSSEDSFVTNPYSIVGTPSYMSPEQVRGAKLTPQSDLFSVGVVLCELFTGKNPFLRDNVSLTLNEIISYSESSLAERITDLPEHLNGILLKLLKKNNTQRYESAEQVLDELDVHVDQPTVVINAINREERKSKLAWVLIGVVLLMIGVVFLMPFLKSGNSEVLPLDSLDQNTNSLSSPSQNEKINKDVSESDQIQSENKLEDSLISDQNPKQETNPTETKTENRSTGLGGLFIECLPWADVTIDGDYIGQTPEISIRPINLQAGDYTLKFTHPDYPPYFRSVKIEAGQVKRVQVSLDATMGFIKCFVHPYGDVYINGEKRGQVPSPGFIRVKPGPIRLNLKNNAYKDIDTMFFIRAGDSLKLKFSFKQ